ncbi:uncharacterized protein LOC115188266 [Salmo trutta]|uniref:uncharacterized protein LOC115182774 n=1 Tax=Salmo trutta TaxID=8032 RepID=UPI001130A9FE|nr:uncharacterized protein LOC115182774 [Salmo trutta]XP_029602971.1 uncharacterized protein LOC115188266 [Salmo trutta]
MVNVESLKSLLDNIVKRLAEGGSFYLIITLIFIQYTVFHVEFVCSCKPEVLNCVMYILIPVFLLMFLVLWTDQMFKRLCRFTCRRSLKCHFGCRLCSLLCKSFCVGLLWIASVLIDGDWYVCCGNNLPNDKVDLPCKKNVLIPEDKNTLAQLRNDSLVIGLLCLLAVAFGFILSIIPPCRCRAKNTPGSQNTPDRGCCITFCEACCKSYHRHLYEESVLEETEIIMRDILKEKAKEYVSVTVSQIRPLTETTNKDQKVNSDEGGNPSVSLPETQRGEGAVGDAHTFDWDKISNLAFDMIDDLHKTSKPQEGSSGDDGKGGSIQPRPSDAVNDQGGDDGKGGSIQPPASDAVNDQGGDDGKGGSIQPRPSDAVNDQGGEDDDEGGSIQPHASEAVNDQGGDDDDEGGSIQPRPSDAVNDQGGDDDDEGGSIQPPASEAVNDQGGDDDDEGGSIQPHAFEAVNDQGDEDDGKAIGEP